MPEFDPTIVRRILVIKLRAIGDSVLTLPSVRALASGFPKAAVRVLAPGHSVEVFAHDPAVEQVIAYPRDRLRKVADHFEFYEQLQRHRFDLAVCLHASFRTALIGWMSGAPWRSVRNHSGRDWFCNVRATEAKEAKSIVQRDFDALRALGLKPANDQPQMVLSKAALAEADSFFKGRKLGRKVVALLPGAGKPEKAWPAERFASLALRLKKAGYTPLPLLDPSAPEALLKVMLPWKPAGFGSLQTLSAVLAKCSGAVGNDSGPRHLAAAAGTATFTLFGPEGQREWHPYERSRGHETAQAISGKVEDLSLDTVWQGVQGWLKKPAVKK